MQLSYIINVDIIRTHFHSIHISIYVESIHIVRKMENDVCLYMRSYICHLLACFLGSYIIDYEVSQMH